MPPEPIVDDQEYASSDDSDFAPDDAPDHVSSADEGDGDDNDEPTETTATTTKRKREDAEADDAGFENSGDEAIIGKGKKKRRRKDKEGGDDEEETGAGGFVKTRSQRAQEKAERRATTVHGPVTVDIDALWAQMTADPKKKQEENLASLAAAAMSGFQDAEKDAEKEEQPEASTKNDDENNMVKIKRTYNFAGKVHTEEKLVARDSAEAKLYFEGKEAQDKENGDEKETPEENAKPPPRKAFRSAFEPVLDLASLRTDLDLGLKGRLQARERAAAAAANAAKKLNTVEKSRMDWAGFVDKAGIQEELALAGKAKGSFAERQQFLARSDALREEEARKARLASSAAAAAASLGKT